MTRTSGALRYFGRIRNGTTPASGEAEYWDGDVLWATPEDLGKLAGHRISQTKRRVTEKAVEECNLPVLPPGSVIISTRAPIGHMAINEVPMAFNQGCRGIIPRNSVDKFFLYYLLNSRVSELDAMANRTTFVELSRDELAAVVVDFPTLETQRRIARFLDEKTARIDRLIEKKRALLDQLAEKRQAQITRAVTKGLDPDAPMKPSGIDWLGNIPAHWEILPVKRVAKLESGHTPDKKVEDYWKDCHIPWVSLNDTAVLRAADYITETTFNINELGLANSSARLLPARAVVFTRDATIGESAITTRPMAVSQHIIAWLCNETRVIPEFLLFVIYGMTGELLRLTNGSTIGTIGLADVRSIRMALPPLEEQEAIASRIFGWKARVDDVASRIGKSIERLEEYRSALITAAVTGKLDLENIADPPELEEV